MSRLKFPALEVAKAMAHARSAQENWATYGVGEAGPQLWWVKDDGVYVMSNGRPRDDGEAVVYAVGYHRTDAGVWERARAVCGGDDFAEPIDLGDLEPIPEDAEFLVIDVLGDKFTVSWQCHGTARTTHGLVR